MNDGKKYQTIYNRLYQWLNKHHPEILDEYVKNYPKKSFPRGPMAALTMKDGVDSHPMEKIAK